ncbi:MAG: hypothetical protein Q7K34_00330 [archaeon]|nr:hypothetical protein [archaeon]
MDKDQLTNVFKQEFKNFGDFKIYLFITPMQDFIATNVYLVQYLCNELKKSGLIINVNEPSQLFAKRLKKDKVDTNLLSFIDIISMKDGIESNMENCVFLEKPDSLAALSDVLSGCLAKRKTNYLFIDSLSTLLLYNQVIDVERFTHYLVNKIKIFELDGVFLTINDKHYEQLAPMISQFADNLVDLTKL